MDEQNSCLWMILMALVLGVRHGFDLDHLATIDAMTRTVRENRGMSRIVGFLFSLGHGLVVMLISVVIGCGLIQAHVPEWFDGLGNWISVVFLLVFGVLNVWNLFQNPLEPMLPVGLRSFLAKKLACKTYTPWMIMLVGALFALSFDTISQIALFSISASLVSGWVLSLVLGLVFMLGMMLSDGLNGLLVSVLIQRADRASLILSRGLGATISIFSITVGGLGLMKIVQ